MVTFAIKIDVDTERGTRIGVPNLIQLLTELKIPATFFFSLGPDNTGRALKRVFRPGFLKKVSRTNVVSTYGIRTLLNGVLWPGPHIANKHSDIMRLTKSHEFEVGIHCYDHTKWQDNVHKMTAQQIDNELQLALNEFQRVFHCPAKTAGAPGWQANAKTLTIYDNAGFNYASDCRGNVPFYPQVDGKQFRTLQIPTTLPTLDELIGQPEYPLHKLTAHYVSLLQEKTPNVMTIHAELEGMKYLKWFREFLVALQDKDVTFKTLQDVAKQHQNAAYRELRQGIVPGRSGMVAITS